MRVTLAAGALADALAFVAGAIEKRVVIPILGDCKIKTRDGLLILSATNLDMMLTAAIAASDSEPGVAIAPCSRLAKLTAELPADAEATLACDGDRLTIKSGRGRWSLPTMAPEDFPVLSAPGADAASFTLPQAEARRLVNRVASAISSEETRYYLAGMYLTAGAGRLICVATNGHKLAVAESEIDPGTMPAIIVPRRAIDVLDTIARGGDVTVRADAQCVEFSGGGLCCVSKLIDAAYPDYARIAPEPSNNRITVERAALLAAVSRLAAVSGVKEVPTIGLVWDSGTTLSLCLTREPELGGEEIEPTASGGTGKVAASAHYLIEQLEALGGETVQLDHAAPSMPIRVTRPDEPSTITLIMPMRWEQPAVEVPVERPQRRAKGR